HDTDHSPASHTITPTQRPPEHTPSQTDSRRRLPQRAPTRHSDCHRISMTRTIPCINEPCTPRRAATPTPTSPATTRRGNLAPPPRPGQPPPPPLLTRTRSQFNHHQSHKEEP